MIDGTVSLRVQDEELVLHPERAVLWPRRKTVIVADTHFGKSSFFGRHGIPVPAGSDAEDRNRLSRLLSESGAQRLIILGDFLHAAITSDSRDAAELDTWARGLAPVEIVVVAGNHDRGTPRNWSTSIAWREGAWLEPPFQFVHDAARRLAKTPAFALSGHIHPVMRLHGRRKLRLRVPVFWQRPTGLILPSFGAFTGGFAVQAGPGEHLFAVAPGTVAHVR